MSLPRTLLPRTINSALVLGLLLIGGCTTPPPSQDHSQDVLEWIKTHCTPPNFSEFYGRGWIQLRDKDSQSKGRLPFQARIRHGGELVLEITNLLGATEARLKQKGEGLVLERPGHAPQVVDSQWYGISPKELPRLLTGQVPCVETPSKQVWLRDTNTLHVQGRIQTHYRAEKIKGEIWVGEITLHSVKATVKEGQLILPFPENDRTGFPWEFSARSSQGELKLQWNERKFR